MAILAPAGTAPEVAQKLNDAINRVLQLPDVRERFEGLAFDAVGGSPRDFAEYLHTEVAHWAVVVRETGAKLE